MSGGTLSVTVVTSLYPSAVHPHRGIFAERRWLALAARGHAVQVVHPQPYAPPFAWGRWREFRKVPSQEVRGGLSINRPRYLHLPGKPRQNARRFGRAANRCLGKPDVVVCDYAWPAAALAPLCRAEGLPCLINGRGSDVLEVAGEANLGLELGQYLAASSGWAAVSQDLVDAMDRLGLEAGSAHRGVLIPNGVDRTRFFPRERSECRRQLQLDLESPLVLVVGHLIDRKDPLLALEAFASGASPEARLLFVGRGPLEGAVLSRIRELGLTERAQCVGEVQPDRLALYYGAADLLLLTSSREGRPNVVLEALACGRPVLATDAGGTAELLGDSRMLSLDRSPSHLGQLLRSLLDDPPSAISLLEHVAHLTWEHSTDTLESLLQGVGGD